MLFLCRSYTDIEHILSDAPEVVDGVHPVYPDDARARHSRFEDTTKHLPKKILN